MLPIDVESEVAGVKLLRLRLIKDSQNGNGQLKYNHFVRRFLYWYVPVAAALIAAAVFADGFYSYIRGDVGAAVNVLSAPRMASAVAAAPRAVIMPIILGDSLARGTGDDSGLGIGGRVVENLRR